MIELQNDDHVKALFDRLVANGFEGTVTERLRDGRDVSTKVGPPGNHPVIIRGPAGMNLFDAYVVYEAITGIAVRIRSCRR